VLPIEVIVMRLDTGAEAVAEAARLLSRTERVRAATFPAELERRRFVAALAQLRELLGGRLAVAPETVELARDRRGKPALAPGFAGSELRFSFAHSEDVAVHVFADGLEVGIHLELVREVPVVDRIGSGLFSHAECEAYRLLDPIDRPLAFLRCWTRKEALLRALGDGGGPRLDRYTVSLTPGEPARILEMDGVPGERCGFTLADFSPGRGLVGAVAVQAS
jgi:4'-phosphopantetheinyl transferase